MISNDERRKELDLVLKHLYDGKLLTTMHDDRPPSDISESSMHTLSRTPITTTTTTRVQQDEENKMNLGNLEVSSDVLDVTSSRSSFSLSMEMVHHFNVNYKKKNSISFIYIRKFKNYN